MHGHSLFRWLPKSFAVFEPMLAAASNQKKRLLFSIGLGILYAGVNAGFFYFMKPMLSGSLKTNASIRELAFYILAFYCLKSVLYYVSEILSIAAIQDTIAAVRIQFLQNYFGAQARQDISGEIVSRFLEDINQMCGAVKLFTATLIKDSFTLLGLVIVLFLIAPQLAFIVLFIYAITAFPTRLLGQKTKKRVQDLRATQDNLLGQLAEFIKHRNAVKNWHATSFVIGKINQPIVRDAHRQKKLSQIDRGAPLLIEFLAVVTFTGIFMLWGVNLFAELTISNTVIFSLASLALYTPLKNLGSFHIGLKRAQASAERLEMFIQKPAAEVKYPPFSHRAQLHIKKWANPDSSFILENISLIIKKGERIGLSGKNGSGKSSLLECFAGMRLFEGHISLDGKKNMAPHILYAGSTPTLFNISIRENLTFGRKVSDSNLLEKLEFVGLTTLFRHNKMNLDTQLGESGQRLSQGMKQRLILARILLHQPEIILLDEFFDAIEQADRLILLDHMIENLHDCTLIMATHNAELLKNMDRVIEIENGFIVGKDAMHCVSTKHETSPELAE